MDVLQAVEGIKQHIEQFARSAAEKLEQELPVVGNLAQQASGNPAIVALLNAVHLPEAPEYLEALAAEIGKIDQALADAKAKAAADATTAVLATQQQAGTQMAEPAEQAAPPA